MDGASGTVEVLADAYQFARHNQFIADLAPLQLYASALLFAPDLSIIKTSFKPCMPSWLLTPPRIERPWRSDVVTFEGHTNIITAIVFSPDDELIGTCSCDGTARIWDRIDASCSLTTSHDVHNCRPVAIAFSSDSLKFAVAYTEKGSPISVIVTTRTGISLRTMQCPELWSGTFNIAIAFEDDDIVLVAADKDQVQVWRPVNDSNNLIHHWTTHLPDHKGVEWACVCISQDASSIYYSARLGNESFSISVLDPKTQVVISRHVLEEAALGVGNFSGVVPVCLVFDSETRRFNIRSPDVEHKGEYTHLFECASLSWRKFSLANAGDRFAFNRTDDSTVRVEAIAESKMVGERMEASPGRGVGVAPSGNLVANWDHGRWTVLDTQGLATKETMLDVDEEGFEYTYSMTFSHDCQHIARGRTYGITVWNIETGELSKYNAIRDGKILAVSNTNRLVATRQLMPNLLRVWDLASNQIVSETDLPRFRRLEFSADGKDLITEHGRFHIATATWTTSGSTSPPSCGKDFGFPNSVSRPEWVQFDHEDLLWIPDEYRADHGSYDARGGTVALGQKDGSVLIMKFSDPSVTD
jgi:WD40 repeat protein